MTDLGPIADEALYARAAAAFCRKRSLHDWPGEPSSEMHWRRDGTATARLANCKGPLATYRYFPASDRLRQED